MYKVSVSFIFQVGNGHTDHSFWGRPEEMNMYRPAYKITQHAPGSELAGETAAAMAAGYLVFRSRGKVGNDKKGLFLSWQLHEIVIYI